MTRSHRIPAAYVGVVGAVAAVPISIYCITRADVTDGLATSELATFIAAIVALVIGIATLFTFAIGDAREIKSATGSRMSHPYNDVVSTASFVRPKYVMHFGVVAAALALFPILLL